MNNQENIPLISIVIPVYNVEKYLERCLESVISQTYSNLEIILVNDGSTDMSGEICNTYQKKDMRIKTIHKKNGGLSEARNTGIDIAKGEYISFIDSDDWVTTSYIEELYNLVKKYECDVAICSIKKTTKCKEYRNLKNREIVYLNSEIVKQFLYQRISTSAYAKLFKKELWEAVRFPVGKIYEDVLPLYKVLSKCSKVCVTSQYCYMYYYREGSIVNQKFSLSKMDYVENCRKVLECVKCDYPQFQMAAISRLVWSEIHVLMHMENPHEYDKEYEMLMRDIKKYRYVILKDDDNKFKVKAVTLLTITGYKVMRSIYRLTI